MTKVTLEFVKTKDLPTCTEDQCMEFYNEAKKFIECTGYYTSVLSYATGAVAEYMAYQKGYTLRKWK